MSISILIRYVGNATITLMSGNMRDVDGKLPVAYSVQLPYVPGSPIDSDSGRVESGTINVGRVVISPVVDAYGSLLSFLAASAEAYDAVMSGRESADDAEHMFGPGVAAWASEYADQLCEESMLVDDERETFDHM